MSLLPAHSHESHPAPFEVPRRHQRGVVRYAAGQAVQHARDVIDDTHRLALTALRIDNGAQLTGLASHWSKQFSDEQLALLQTNPLAADRSGFLADQYAIGAAEITRDYMRGGR